MRRESIMRGFPICVALLIFVVLTTGCVGPTVRTYSGNKLQQSEVAVINGRCYFPLPFYDCVVIYTFDGSKLETETAKVEVLPGRHELIIRDNIFGSRSALLWTEFNFEAGHEYKIKDSFLFFRNRVEIIDVNTGVTIFSEAWLR